MPACVRKLLLAASASGLVVGGLAAPAQAGTSGVYLPPAPTGSGGEDSIETSGGTRCRQSINSSGPYVDLGVAGTTSSTRDRNNQSSILYADQAPNEATAYARITIPIGRKPQRIDCSQVFELEVARLKREIELLKLGVQ
ncbi:hypothetical protein HL653_06530 [Sphingomonas sp. AP4-R1]|uniref:hypothetical protein n=1 Tax=Sphingomonas sp. AP4-R1 TaxID=2735134 RepID=UPI0014937F6E|nr:hypothetical protein [Sphingomonas sp. AP4-R1]QJU57492.1 hypothetical protein HL653_06530 [Sphingomonas sp. AP4-R1]